MSKNINSLLRKIDKLNEKRVIVNNPGDCVPLDNRYFNYNKFERREPLITHPCIHWIGSHNQ